MKLIKCLVIIFSAAVMNAQNINFNDYFIDKTMRIDYYHIGDDSKNSLQWIMSTNMEYGQVH